MMSRISRWTLALLATVSLSTSCMKVPSLSDDLGDAVNPQAVEDEMEKAWGDFDLNKIQKGDFAYIEKTAQLQNGEPSVALRKGITISQIDKQSSGTTFTFLIQSEEMGSDQQSKLSTRESKACYDCQRSSASQAAVSETSAEKVTQKDAETDIITNPFDNFLNSIRMCGYRCTNASQCGDLTVDCFKMSVENTVEAAPRLVAAAPNCRGLKDCKINVKNIQFVYVIKQTDPETKKLIEYKSIKKLKISPDLPFFSRLIENCFQTFVTINQQKYPVQFCEKVQDFQRGSTP
jgi:hypothetical protein